MGGLVANYYIAAIPADQKHEQLCTKELDSNLLDCGRHQGRSGEYSSALQGLLDPFGIWTRLLMVDCLLGKLYLV